MNVLNDRARQAIAGGHLAHFVTTNADGSPQITVVWSGVDGDEIVTAHLHFHHKVRNIQRDPRVAISWETGGKSASGLDEYLVVYGTARITEGGAAALLHELAQIYIGPGTKFPPTDDPPPGWILRITPERVGGLGPWSTAGS
jgi:PPOX class probable F420-dependent enzyme